MDYPQIVEYVTIRLSDLVLHFKSIMAMIVGEALAGPDLEDLYLGVLLFFNSLSKLL